MEGDRILVGTGEGWRSPSGVTLVIEVERAKFAKLPFTHAPAGVAR